MTKDILATFRIDADLWGQFKTKASEERYSASSLLLGFVTDYVVGNVDGAAPTVSDARIDKRIDELAHRLERRIDERIDRCIESRLDPGLESRLEVAKAEPEPEKPISTSKLCDHLGINSKSLSRLAKQDKCSTEEYLIAKANERGELWQVCDRNGRHLLWAQVGARC
jgi:hypothetical protein